MYCGHSYEAAIRTFELACQGHDLAGHIRELLGLQKVYYCCCRLAASINSFQVACCSARRVLPPP